MGRLLRKLQLQAWLAAGHRPALRLCPQPFPNRLAMRKRLAFLAARVALGLLGPGSLVEVAAQLHEAPRSVDQKKLDPDRHKSYQNTITNVPPALAITETSALPITPMPLTPSRTRI